MIFFAGYGEAATLNLLRRFRHQRICIVFHFPYEQVPHRYAEFAHSGLVQRADAVVAVSEYVARGVKAHLERDCAVIGNGVARGCILSSARASRGNAPATGDRAHAPVLITVAALEERKGVQWVIRALPLLLSDFPDLCYIVLGEGAYRAQLQAEIERLDLAGHMRLVGNTDDVISYLATADVGCLLSYGESFGIALVEYMAMALPVLSSAHPPFDELMRPDWGVMVDEIDSTGVARTLRELLTDPQRRQRMGQAGRQQVVGHHTWAQVAEQYLALLASPQPA